MSRIALDSVKYANMAGLRWPHLIGYANGRISAWSDHDIADARSRGQLLALVDVLGTSPHLAAVVDFERGDVQSPTVIHRWVQARNQFRGDATVYVQPGNIRTIVRAVGAEPCNLWVVDLTADGEPPFHVPDYGPLPANVRVIGRQFVFGPRAGGDYDMSVIYADDWHPDQPHPANYAPVRLAAAAELGISGSLAWAATVPVDPDPAAAAGPVAITTTAELAAAAVPSMPPGYSAALAAGLLGPVAATASPTGQIATVTPLITAADTAAPAADVDQVAAELADVDHGPSGSGSDDLAAARSAAEVTEEHAAAQAAAAAAPIMRGADPVAAGQAAAAPDTILQGAAEFAAEVSSSTAAAVIRPIEHEFIRATLADVGKVAQMLRASGWGASAALELERAASIAWELGSALKSAGL